MGLFVESCREMLEVQTRFMSIDDVAGNILPIVMGLCCLGLLGYLKYGST